MKINAALVKNRNIKATEKSLIFAFISVASGFIIGSVLFSLNKEFCTAEISDIFIKFTERFSAESSASILLTMLITRLIYFTVIFISGTSIAGKEIIILYTLINFGSLSMIASFLYSSYNLRGLEYCLLVFYPGKILYIFSSLLLVKNALEYCKSLKNTPIEAVASKRHYISTAGVILFIYTSGIIMDFILTKLFSSLFAF